VYEIREHREKIFGYKETVGLGKCYTTETV
jgi:hypothetical protein